MTTKGFFKENGKTKPITQPKGINPNQFSDQRTDIIKIPVNKAPLWKRIFSSNTRKHQKNLQDATSFIIPKIIEINKAEDKLRLQVHKYDYPAYHETIKKMQEIQKEIDDSIKRNHLNHDKGKSELVTELQKHFKIFDNMKVYLEIPFESLNQKWDQKQIKFLNENKLLINSSEDYNRLKHINTEKIKKQLIELDKIK